MVEVKRMLCLVVGVDNVATNGVAAIAAPAEDNARAAMTMRPLDTEFLLTSIDS
jgi:hypothetical protein